MCEGPLNEKNVLDKNSKLVESSAPFVAKEWSAIAGQPRPRPGQDRLQSTLADFDERLENLKSQLSDRLSERRNQLERAKECAGILEGMTSWLDGCQGNLDGLTLRDPGSDVIKSQQVQCQVRSCTLNGGKV